MPQFFYKKSKDILKRLRVNLTFPCFKHFQYLTCWSLYLALFTLPVVSGVTHSSQGYYDRLVRDFLSIFDNKPIRQGHSELEDAYHKRYKIKLVGYNDRETMTTVMYQLYGDAPLVEELFGGDQYAWDVKTLRDLRITCGTQENRACTVIGNLDTRDMSCSEGMGLLLKGAMVVQFATPPAKQEVVRRQKIMQLLGEKKKLRHRLLAVLNDFKEKHEKPFIAHFREDHVLRLSQSLERLKRQYANGGSLSDCSTYRLEVWKRWAVDLTFISIMLNSFLTLISLCYKIPLLFPNTWIGSLVDGLLEFLHGGRAGPRPVLQTRLELTSLRYEAMRGLFFIAVLPSIFLKFYYMHRDTLAAYAEGFYHQQQWYAMVKEVYGLVQGDKDLAPLCGALLENTESLVLGDHGDEDLLDYLHLLETQRLASFSLFFSFVGRLLKTVGLFERCYQSSQLLNTIYEISSLGVLIHLAHYVECTKGGGNSLSYVDFVEREQQTIFIDMNGLWNLGIAPHKAVGDDLYMDGSESNVHMYLGSNAGGKTTKVKALGVSIVMAQVYGLSPAKRASHVFFDALLTYYNIGDGDFVTGLSQYTSELERVEYVLNMLERLGSTRHVLCLVDEPATGTGEVFAKILTGELISYLVEHYPNSGFFFITHYRDLRKLAMHHPMIQNYKVLIDHIGEEDFRYTYKMDLGVPSREDDLIALKILRKRKDFPEELRLRIEARVKEEV